MAIFGDRVQMQGQWLSQRVGSAPHCNERKAKLLFRKDCIGIAMEAFVISSASPSSTHQSLQKRKEGSVNVFRNPSAGRRFPTEFHIFLRQIV
jgi:hypothetical protein